MNRTYPALLLSLVCAFRLSALPAEPEPCRNFLGGREFPRGWELSQSEAVKLAQKSDQHQRQMLAVVQTIQLLDSAPPEFFQLLAVTVPAFTLVNKPFLSETLDLSRSPVERGQSESSSNERWQMTGLAVITRVLKLSHPTWAGRLEAADFVVKDWLSHAAMAIPKLQLEPIRPDVLPGEQLIASLERFLKQQPLAPDWAMNLAGNSNFVREELARAIVQAFERLVNQPLQYNADVVTFLAKKIIDSYFDDFDQKKPEWKDTDSDKGSWMANEVLRLLEQSLKTNPNLQRKNFATMFVTWAARLSKEAQQEQELAVIGEQRLIIAEDAANRILRELEVDRINSSRSIPLLFSCLLATVGKIARWPTADLAKRFFYTGVQRQLRLVR
jgi:hypothetical protein